MVYTDFLKLSVELGSFNFSGIIFQIFWPNKRYSHCRDKQFLLEIVWNHLVSKIIIVFIWFKDYKDFIQPEINASDTHFQILFNHEDLFSTIYSLKYCKIIQENTILFHLSGCFFINSIIFYFYLFMSLMFFFKKKLLTVTGFLLWFMIMWIVTYT